MIRQAKQGWREEVVWVAVWIPRTYSASSLVAVVVSLAVVSV